MNRSKAFFKAAIKTHRERMLATFERAKKHTRKFIASNPQMKESRFSFVSGNDFLQQGMSFVKEAYANFLLRIGRFSVPTDRWILSVQKNFQHLRNFFFGIYEKWVVRGEYTKRSLTVLFVVAFFLGATIKTIASERITIGFEDYTLAPKATLYDINRLQQKVIDQGDASFQNYAAEGGACSEFDN